MRSAGCKKRSWIALVVAVLSGLAIGVQATLNSAAGKIVGATLTGLLVNFTGGAAAGVILAVMYLRLGNGGFSNLNPTSMGIIFISGLLGIGIITGRGLRISQNRHRGGLGGDHRLANGGSRDGGYAGIDGRAAHPAELDADRRAGAAGAGDVGDIAETLKECAYW